MHTGDWLERRAQYTPDKVAVIVEPGGARFTYRELNERADRAALALRAAGVGKGDRVAVLAQNGVEHLDVLFACGKLGAVFVPLNFRLTPAELAPQVGDAEPSLLLYGEPYAGVAGALQGLCPVEALADFTARGQAFAGQTCPGAPVAEADPWMILYTGGTTGRSKGAMLSHRMVTANAINTIASWQLRPDDVAPVFTPFFHTGGLNVLTTPLILLGGTLVLMQGAFDPGLAIEVVEKHGVTVLFLVPTMFQMVSEHPRFATAAFASVRFFISGGAPCPRPVMEAYWAKGKVFKQGYGLTEVGPNNFVLPDSLCRRKPDSVGFPTLFTQVRLTDPEGRDVPPGTVGEVWLAGPHVCSGYWRNEAASRAANPDGWFRTGDLAYRDTDGCYYIVDRKKDMFISGGENVYPLEVETVLYQHPAVAECAVIGVPDPRWGEVGLAVVVLRPGHPVTADDLLAHCRDRLARYKVPKAIEFRDSLPRSAAGKILKRELRRPGGN